MNSLPRRVARWPLAGCFLLVVAHLRAAEPTLTPAGLDFSECTQAKGERTDLRLNAFLSDSVKQGVKEIRIPKGVYHVALAQRAILSRCGDVTLRGGTANAADTRLLYTGMEGYPRRLKPFFGVWGCRNTTLRDFTIDYDPLNFTQGTIFEIKGA